MVPHQRPFLGAGKAGRSGRVSKGVLEIDSIIIRGAREHNLKNINLELPRNKFIVITGLSGSGKSSLAFDTLYAEGQRRYVESLSAYARQFLGQMEKPDVDDIRGLSPAISIDQKGGSRNPRSTVGTITEIYDYLRLLFARIGHPHCPSCGKPIRSQTAQQIVDQILALPEGSRVEILAPLVRGRKGEYQKMLADMEKEGFLRVRVDGKLYELGEEIPLDKNRKHTIEVVVDRLKVTPEIRKRAADSVEEALRRGGGLLLASLTDKGEELLFSEKAACADCGINLEEPAPRLFSFNSPYGACKECTGLGIRLELDPSLVVPDPEKSLAEGAIAPWGQPKWDFRFHASESYYWHTLRKIGKTADFSFDVPWKELTGEQQQLILYGKGGKGLHSVTRFEGVIPNLTRRYRETQSDWIREEIEKYMSNQPCLSCGGARLRKESLAVTVGDLPIHHVTRLSVGDALSFFQALALSPREQTIAHQVLKEIKARLHFMVNVGLSYLTLDRAASTLSGGEAQRIRLATQIGSGLVGVLYILDEPSIGLHPADNTRLLATLSQLRDLGNTLIVVEHDEETIRSADVVVDIGPGAGALGGEIVACGPLSVVLDEPRSITGKYLKGELSIPIPHKRRIANSLYLEVLGAREHNLKNIHVRIPLGLFVCITGVSGSGKSTLVHEILYKALSRQLYKSLQRPGDFDGLRGTEFLDKVLIIDQSPIGRTPRSNPATYTGVFDPIRKVFSQTPEARMRGYLPGRFSFNLKGGRCETCQGQGILQIEMHFLPDVYVLCEECKGKRFNRETLEVHFKGKNISEVLNMTVTEALEFFQNIPQIERKLSTLSRVGLGYIELGQPATTLSGGEAQRVKLATELSRKSTGRTLYILDEPTTGLHFHDIAKLLDVLHDLVEGGNTVVVIEHNLDVIKTADHLIDLGPEGGDQGGEIVAEGTPEEVSQHPLSHTGRFLGKVLDKGQTLTPALPR